LCSGCRLGAAIRWVHGRILLFSTSLSQPTPTARLARGRYRRHGLLLRPLPPHPPLSPPPTITTTTSTGRPRPPCHVPPPMPHASPAVDIITGARVTKLLTVEDPAPLLTRVVGVEYTTEAAAGGPITLNSDAVVLTSGGYGYVLALRSWRGRCGSVLALR
jgi:hypothetical protein